MQRHKYLELVEQEINGIVMWASLQKKTVVLADYLNMDRLRTEWARMNDTDRYGGSQ